MDPSPGSGLAKACQSLVVARFSQGERVFLWRDAGAALRGESLLSQLWAFE